jgi:hypothetical protein
VLEKKRNRVEREEIDEKEEDKQCERESGQNS